MIITAAAWLFVSCEKIIAEDISNELPVMLVPAVNDTVESNPVHFKWEEMEGATKYHLMVVSPSFASISSYVLDTMVTGTDFYFQLDSNVYELKLAAVNGGYVSDTVGPIQFWVGVQSTTSGGSVVLNDPADGEYRNGSFNGKFFWSSLSSADSYEFSLRSGTSFSNGTIVDYQNNISTLNYTSTATFSEGEYHWGVKAYLISGGETSFTTRVLYIDATDPNQAVLSSPGNFGNMNSGNVVFTWNNGTDPGTVNSPVNSFVEVSSDAAFGTIVESQVVQGNTATFNLNTGTYFWRVTNSDDAGNAAAVSGTNQFNVN